MKLVKHKILSISSCKCNWQTPVNLSRIQIKKYWLLEW